MSDSAAQTAQPSAETEGSSEELTERAFAVDASRLPGERTYDYAANRKAEKPAEKAPEPKEEPAAASPKTQPAEEPEGSSEEAKRKPTRKDLPPEYEPVLESAIQGALKAERDRAAKEQRERDDATRKQDEEKARDAERQTIRDLYRRAVDNRDPAAEQELLDKYLISLGSQFQSEEAEKTLKERLDPILQERTGQFRDELWKSHASAFGVEPDDAAFKDVPADKGLKGLNLVMVEKTADEELVGAMLKNKAVQKAVKDQLAKETRAAAEDAKARALGSDEAPKLTPGNGGTGEALTDKEIDAGYMKNPNDQRWAKLWRDKEVCAGRSV